MWVKCVFFRQDKQSSLGRPHGSWIGVYNDQEDSNSPVTFIALSAWDVDFEDQEKSIYDLLQELGMQTMISDYTTACKCLFSIDHVISNN
jgi:hypothetical protein